MIINNYARCEFFYSLVITHHSFLPDTMVNYRQVNYSPVMIYCGYWLLFPLDCCHISEWQWKIMLQIGCERKEKSSLKCKTGRAANLGKFQNGKVGENYSPPRPPPIIVDNWNCTNYQTHEFRKAHSYLSTPWPCLSGSKLLHLVINYEFSETGSAFGWILTMQNRSFWSLILASVVRNCCIVSQWHL